MKKQDCIAGDMYSNPLFAQGEWGWFSESGGHCSGHGKVNAQLELRSGR